MEAGRSPRVLFIRPDHIGDVLLTLPAVTALRRELPAAHLAYAAPAASAAVAERCPDVDETLRIRFPAIGRRGSDGRAWTEAVHEEIARIRGAFDAALVIRPDDPWSGELVAAASIPIRLGFDMPRTRRYLTDVLPVPRDQHVSLDAFDLGDALLARLGIGARTARLLEARFVPSPDDEEEARAVLADAGADEAAIVLHPGSGWPLKNWPAPRWRRLAAERSLAQEVAEGTPAIDVAGRLSLGALAVVHRRARLVVTTDSGALHLAAVMGARVVGLFGPGDPVLFAPLADAEHVRVVRAALPCSPCGTLEDPPCGATVDPDCVTEIRAEAVLRAAAELLTAARAGGRFGADQRGTTTWGRCARLRVERPPL